MGICVLDTKEGLVFIAMGDADCEVLARFSSLLLTPIDWGATPMMSFKLDVKEQLERQEKGGRHDPVFKIGKYDGDLDANGNVFWGYSISGCDEHGAPILPTLASVHNFPDQVEANARLIAAAPELLEALKGLAEDYTAVCHDRQSKYKSPNGICAFDNALAAISKASPTQTEEG
jgi:hypothetical protein